MGLEDTTETEREHIAEDRPHLFDPTTTRRVVLTWILSPTVAFVLAFAVFEVTAYRCARRKPTASAVGGSQTREAGGHLEACTAASWSRVGALTMTTVRPRRVTRNASAYGSDPGMTYTFPSRVASWARRTPR